MGKRSGGANRTPDPNNPILVLRGYQTGFVLAALLTIIPFALVASGTFSTIATLWVIGILGLVQIVVHVRYLLHVDLSPQRREEL